MSKKKLLIHEVFRKAQEDFPNRSTKSGWSNELSDYFERTWNFIIHERTFTRYYNACIRDGREPDIIDKEILDKLSQYIGYKNFNHFSTTFVRKDEKGKSTTVHVDVDDYDGLQSEKEPRGIKIIITQYFNLPEFVKKNGLGIFGVILIIGTFVGNKYFSNDGRPGSIGNLLGGGWGINLDIDKKYMYWNGQKYIATDSSYLGPHLKVVPMNPYDFKYFKKITRKDTMTLDNSLGKVWCSKFNNTVDFFTMDGINPENGKELKLATDHMILKYSGKK